MLDVMKQAGASGFGTFDILSDETVRNGLKQYSNWPTFPQLYVRESSSVDSILRKELLESGELKDMLAKV